MRTTTIFNEGWSFCKEDEGIEAALSNAAPVAMPHTWNAKDGQDGGNDYYRGTCWYVKRFAKADLPEADEQWLEFQGAAMTAEVFLNGTSLTRHEGGYSTFRCDMTECLQEENVLAVSVDNSKNDCVYPQKADFTFYGGIYRDISVISVPKAHFALDYYGGCGLSVTPEVKEQEAVVEAVAYVTAEAKEVVFTVDGQQQTVAVADGCAKAVFTISAPHLWDGLDDPYLYRLSAEIPGADAVEVSFGCRTYSVDPQRGFILNGRPYPLCGAARHQDRQGVGNVLTHEMQDEDMAIMKEMGLNTIRLAHYQHNQYFYDLCDKEGMIVWAEIPYITQHLEGGDDNTKSQLKELVIQNYHHPSIICWCLSNEITASGGVSDAMIANHKELNELCHQLDSTRLTAMAHAFMLDMHDDLVMLPDIRSYNLYYGWYLGELKNNDEWFDDFHKAYPDAVIGLSEYGADANPAYQAEKPQKGDWTEGYQALYHEHMLNMWKERPYIWAMHVWNMFDFGADGRNEGGKAGQNQKGLVTFDRKLKKDAFYIYKAYLSKEPFVHICGRRYVDRAVDVTQVKVYSNQPSVTLFVDGKEFAAAEGDKVFTFDVPISGEHTIAASAGDCRDEISIRKVDQPNKDYVKEGGEVVNWFDRPDEIAREGYFSILDSMADMKKNPEAAALLERIMSQAKQAMGDVAQGVEMPEAVQRQMDAMPLESVLKQAGSAIKPAMVKQLNAALNQIKK